MTRSNVIPLRRDHQKPGTAARWVFYCLYRPLQTAGRSGVRIWFAHSEAMDGMALFARSGLQECTAD